MEFKMKKINLFKFDTSQTGGSITPNLFLEKPSSLDKYLIATQNENSNKIDNAIGNFKQYKIERKTLWINPSPKGAMGPQKVSVPELNNYQEIEIFYYNWVDQSTHLGIQSIKVPVANGNVFNLFCTIILWGSSGKPERPHFGSRLGSMDTTKNTISFDYNYGAVTDTLPGSTFVNNSWNIPIKIIGYKYV